MVKEPILMKITKTFAALALGVTALTMGFAGVASAHVTVKPGEALTGAFQLYSVGVPVEKDVATTAVKLEMPKGMGHVMPTVKPGWAIDVQKEGSGEEAVVRAITWSGGSISAGLRDDFTFSAKNPESAVELRWKAYQTYADGSVVAWDLTEDEQPKKADGSPDFSKSGPFSVTKVLSQSAQETTNQHIHDNAHDAQIAAMRATLFGVGGMLLGLVAVFLATRTARKPDQPQQ
jgi:uncharacterized protein YcnI